MIKRNIVLSLLILVCSCAKNKVFYSDSFQNSVGTDSTLDIVTWNIENFPKQDDITINYLVEIIDSMNVDIIALQEISSEYFFFRLVNRLDGWSGEKTSGAYGLAFLYKSELSINNIDVVSELDDYNLTRTPYMLELIWEGQIIYIINNHYKCCGNNVIENIYNDEEYRRLQSCLLTTNYIDETLANESVILLGDFNDELSDPDSANVFKPFFAQPEKYKFVDIDVSFGSSAYWSYPSWPSHLDHILITNELFDEFANPGSHIETIRAENYFNGRWNDYEHYISDHRPVGLILNFN